MRAATYLGATKNIGRFGTLHKNDSVTLFEYEVESVIDAKIFKIKDPDFGDSEPGTVYPYGTAVYDLRNIPWNHPQLFKWLKQRGHQTLKNIVSAVESLGITLVLDDRKSSMSMADALYAAAKFYKWNELSVSDVKSFPSTVDSENQEEQEKVDEEQNTESLEQSTTADDQEISDTPEAKTKSEDQETEIGDNVDSENQEEVEKESSSMFSEPVANTRRRR